MSTKEKVGMSDEESKRLRRLEDVRAPIIDEVLAENPGLTKVKLTEMMEEMGFEGLNFLWMSEQEKELIRIVRWGRL